MNEVPSITVAICTYNRADYLPELVKTLQSQQCPVEFEILFINNNSTDNTLEVLQSLSKNSPINIRVVTEIQQGITYARNRAIEEAIHSEFMLIMDDDEIPDSQWVISAYNALKNGNIDSVGGRVVVNFSKKSRPKWLTDDLLGFLAETDYGSKPFLIKNESTPLWTANIAYKTQIFRDNPQLRFDIRYNRQGKGIGGGEDVVMFKKCLHQKLAIFYCPEMVVYHHVEAWRLQRRYFLKLHYISGVRKGRYELADYPKTFARVPLFLYRQAIEQLLKTGLAILSFRKNKIRIAMNFSFALGMIVGYRQRIKK